MNRHVARGLRRVFSILPEADAEKAVSATLRRIRSESSHGKPLLKWAEFTETGRFVRAGVSSLADYLTVLVAKPGDDPDLARMVREVQDGGAEPGRILRAPDGGAFHWVLPTTTSSATAVPEGRLRAFRIDERVFEAVVAHFNAGRRLTEAERRTAFQLVAGTTPREAAEFDGVGVETKRAQIKSACGKLQCGGQLDLVRLLIGQMVYVLAVSEGEAAHAGVAETFVAGHLAAEARLSVERLHDGGLLRCIEAGPPDGAPVIVLHGMMFGMLLSGAQRSLERAGLRLLMPIRRGYLDPRPVLGLRAESRLIEASMKDLALFIEARGLRPCTLVGHSLGGALAMELANARPDLIGRLVLVSTNLARSASADRGYAEELYEGYRSLIRDGGLARAITLEFSEHYPNEGTARTILHRMFGASPSDLEAMEGRSAAAPVYGWFADLYRSSVAGVSEDYAFVMDGPRSGFAHEIPTLVVHGSQDPLTAVGELEELISDRPGIRLNVVEGAGHFLPATHGEDLWLEVSRFLHRTAAPPDAPPAGSA